MPAESAGGALGAAGPEGADEDDAEVEWPLTPLVSGGGGGAEPEKRSDDDVVQGPTTSHHSDSSGSSGLRGRGRAEGGGAGVGADELGGVSTAAGGGGAAVEGRTSGLRRETRSATCSFLRSLCAGGTSAVEVEADGAKADGGRRAAERTGLKPEPSKRVSSSSRRRNSCMPCGVRMKARCSSNGSSVGAGVGSGEAEMRASCEGCSESGPAERERKRGDRTHRSCADLAVEAPCETRRRRA